MIVADKLTKYYGPVAAVVDVSFQLKKGEILGFLGPNGAGKTTTMRMLTTFLYPSLGTAVVNGYDIRKDPFKVKESVGYLPENAPLYEEMRVRDFLKFVAEARRLKNASQVVSRVLRQCFIEDVQNQMIYTLSRGYRQRVCFAQAIIHDPLVLILDEPTVGLDPNQKKEARRMIAEMGEGKAILLSTHILEEAIALCNRAIIISRGHIRVDDTLENLLRRAPGHGTVRLTLKDSVDSSSLNEAIRKLSNVEDVAVVDTKENRSICVRPKPGHDISGAVLECVRQRNCQIISLTMEQGRLEDVFRLYTQEV